MTSPGDDPPSNAGSAGRTTLAAAGLLVWAAILAAWTWKVWPDPVVDSGRELYVAWRLASGEALYRDVAYFNGPLSPYWNALWFRLFGPGITVLSAVNAAVAAGIVTLVVALVKELRGLGPAVLCGAAFIALVVFAPRSYAGSYTYMLPYSHELPHGLLLLLTAIFALGRHRRTGAAGWVPLSGAALGTTLLTKPELGVAALALGVVAAIPLGRTARLRLLVAAAATVVTGWILVALVAGPGSATEGLVTPYLAAMSPDVRGLEFYRWISGTDDPARSLVRLGLATAAYAIAVGIPFFVLDRWGGLVPRRTVPVAMVAFLFAGLSVVLLAVVYGISWWHLFVPLPIVCAIVLVGELTGRLRLLSYGRDDMARGTAGLMSLTALVLLAKIVLFVNLVFYGYALAAPAMVVLFAVVLGTLPAYLARRSPAAALMFGAYAVGLSIGLVASHLVPSANVVRTRTVEVASAPDEFRTDPIRAGALAAAIREVEARIPPGQTLASLPEGLMVNYLTRTPSSLPYTSLLPLELSIYGPHRVEEAFAADPPDWVLVWDRELSVFGRFGSGYGQDLRRWIDARYSEVWRHTYAPPADALSLSSELAVVLLERDGAGA